jgi:general stress protein 26
MNSHPRSSILFLAMLAALVVSARVSWAEAQAAKPALSQKQLVALKNAKDVFIATVRKNGDQSKAAEIWFTSTEDGTVLINTGPDTWKAKRIKRGSPAIVWIATKDGPAFIGTAEITNDRAMQDRIIADYPKKYTLAWMGLFLPSHEKYDAGKSVAIRITPVRELPDGFVSAPGTPAPPLQESASQRGAQPH